MKNNGKWIGFVAAAFLVASGSAMAGSSPAQQCGRIVNSTVLRLIANIEKAIAGVCSGKTTLDAGGTAVADSFNTKSGPKAAAALRKAGTCDPDLNITAGTLDATIDVATVTSLMQNGLPGFAEGVIGCNGTDD